MDLARPLVSILTAAYRTRPEHLDAAIRSALAQTWGAVEVIVSDDSPEPLLRAQIESSDARVRYVHHRPALGTAANHWWCLRACRGDFVAILNHDDTLEDDFVETLMGPLNADPDSSLAFCDHWVIDTEGRRLRQESDRVSAHYGRAALSQGPHKPFLTLLAQQSIALPAGALFRKSCLPTDLPRQAGPAYDLWLTYLLARDGHAAHYVSRRLSSWRCHATNQTSAAGVDWLAGAAACWATVAADPACAAIASTARAKSASASCSAALSALRQGNARQARWLALDAMRRSPRPKTAAVLAAACLPGAWGRVVARRRAAAAVAVQDTGVEVP